MVAVFTELAAQLFDVGVHCPGVPVIIIAPHVVEDFVPGQGHAGVVHQVEQQLEFRIGQFDRFAVHPDHPSGRIDR